MSFAVLSLSVLVKAKVKYLQYLTSVAKQARYTLPSYMDSYCEKSLIMDAFD